MAALVTSVRELRVYDRREGGGLVGLEKLLACLVAAAPDAAGWEWRVAPGAWGHGQFVCGIEDRLNEGETIILTSSELLGALQDDAEYFEHLLLRAERHSVTLSVFDSTYLSLVGPAEIVDSCKGAFARAEDRDPARDA